jgi:hypothetical protein
MSHNRFPNTVLLTLLLLSAVSFELVNSGRSAASEATTEAAQRLPVVVELFTSEGCSSCPPADVLLAQLDRFQPVPVAELIVLSEHVDYWDDIGWKDPFSSHQFSLRQSDYARRFRLDGPYTPQMIVDGDAQLVGSDEKEALRAIGNAAKMTKIPVTLSAPRLQGDKSLVLHVDVKPIGSSSGHNSGQVLVAVADDSDLSSVSRGENAGRTLKHVAVVRTLTSVGTIDGSGEFSKDVTVSTGDANVQSLRVVAFVQEGTSGRVLGAGSTRLSN